MTMCQVILIYRYENLILSKDATGQKSKVEYMKSGITKPMDEKGMSELYS